MKALLTLISLLMMTAGCKISYKKTHLTEGSSVAQSGIYINTKVCLQAVFDNDVAGVEMLTTLNNQDIIPRVTPFEMAAPWYHFSANDMSLTPDILDPDLNPLTTTDRIFVDWVLVEVYQDINGVMTYMDGQSGLIHFNGTIYDTSGFQGILFPELTAGDYYVNIIHRNHLSIGSAATVALNSDFEASTYNIDFTNSATAYLDEGTLSPFVSLGLNSTKCMKAGDLNGDLAIDVSDETAISTNIAEVVASPPNNISIIGYLNSDVDFDGEAQMFTDALGTIPSGDLSLIQTHSGTYGSIHTAD
jgi:hypothetical protein